MASIGCLGDIPFMVSSDTVQTFTNAKMSGSAKFATHQRHTGDALTEFVGNNPDKFNFDMILSAYLGVNPMEQVEKIITYMREGRTLPLVIGDKSIGRYRWTITNYNVRIQTTDGVGNILTVTVTVNLQEYLRS